MSIEENKRIVLEYFSASTTGDTATVDKLLTDDATLWALPSTPFSGVHGREAMVSSDKPISAAIDGPFKFDIEHVTAEEDRVAVTASGEMKLKNGEIYANVYSFLFFLRDGKICHVKEYLDTARFNEVFNKDELAKLMSGSAA